MEGVQPSESFESYLLRVRKASVKRFPAEFFYARDGEINSDSLKNLKACSLPSSVKEGWRIRVWRKLINRPLKALTNLKPDDDVESLGKMSGIFERTKEIRDLQSEGGNSQSEQIELPNYILKAFANLDLEDEKLSQEELVARFKRERRAEVGELLSNYGKGLDLLCTVNTEGDVISRNPDPSVDVYWCLLKFGDYLETLDSKAEVFDFIFDRVFERNENLYNFESFKQLCKPGGIGFNVPERR